MTIGEQLLFYFVMLATPLVLIGVPIFVLRGGLQTFALKPLLKRYAGLNIHDSPQPGDVGFVYHTYRGFLIWFTQDEHRVFAPPEEARVLLARLLRFNFTWGMLSGGLVFIPFLAIANYYTQKRSIKIQAQELRDSP